MCNSEYKNHLMSYRKTITDLDEALINIIAQRFDVVHNIGVLKQKYNIELLDKERHNTHKVFMCDLAKKLNLDPLFIDQLFEIIMQKAVQEQQKLK